MCVVDVAVDESICTCVFMLLTTSCAERCNVGPEAEEHLPYSHHIFSISQPQGRRELQLVDDTTELVVIHSGHILPCRVKVLFNQCQITSVY